MGLPPLVHKVIEVAAATGYDNRVSTFEQVVAGVGASERFDPEGVDRAALEEAIEQAFASQEAAAASWPIITDCDRLQRAFEVLNRQGIVSMENCDFDLQFGVDRVTDAAVERDRLQDVPTRGFCFFHRQDTEGAVEGKGIMLAFGSFETDIPASQSAPVRCSTCGGRGWVQPDPNKFPEPCPSHQTAVVAAAPRTSGQRIGDTVVAACREVGLEVQWAGSGSKRIHLPNIVWRRRRAQATEEDIRDFLTSWELELRVRIPERDPFELVEERAADWFVDSPSLGPAMLQRFREHTARFLETERQNEERWREATHNDRLGAVFATLNERGVLTREALGKTLLDSWAYAGLRLPPDRRGAVFFSDEDVIVAFSGQGLWLAFAGLPVDASDWGARTEALGRELVALLDEHQLSWRWSGAAHERILLTPFTWCRRRWTKAPSYDLCPAKPFVPTHEPSVRVTAAPRLGEIVWGLVDEGGLELRRARRLRASWKQAGLEGPAQVGHLGSPHVFVRAGECTAMMPVAASANVLADEARAREIASVSRRASGRDD
jgi:hypothetical protein